MEGPRAEVAWGYHSAAELGPWVLETIPGAGAEWWLRAEVRTADPFRLTQAPLLFIIDNSAANKPPFERVLLDAHLEAGVLTGRLGPRKR